jgi:hypothetical protein
MLNFSTKKRKMFTVKNVFPLTKRIYFLLLFDFQEELQGSRKLSSEKKISCRKPIFRAQIWTLCRCPDSGSNAELDTAFRSETQKTQEFSKQGM